MRSIGLMITPGKGYQDVDINNSDTVADLVTAYNLHGRSIAVDGEEISPADFATTSLSNVTDVWATGGAKAA